MSGCCDHDHGHDHGHGHDHDAMTTDASFRRVLWISLAVNAAMFVTEAASSFAAGSTALLADSLDFFADSTNYAISLYALALGARARSRAALVKGLSMGAIGLWVMGAAAHKVATGAVPDPFIMGPVGLLALLANVFVAVLVYSHRKGDANRESVWLCSRNDAIGNIVVMLAASGVFATASYWPDVVVAVVMAGLSLAAAWRVVRRALRELGAPSRAMASRAAEPGAAE
ncbi:MAG: cation transporter [Alphaproteobacteria bacterium]|nr:cation transporter [Alphaproteobacteria bacterium]